MSLPNLPEPGNRVGMNRHKSYTQGQLKSYGQQCWQASRKALEAEQAQAVEPVTTTRALTQQERAELVAAGVGGRFVRVVAFNDRPAPPLAEPPVKQQGHDFSLNLLEKLEKTLTDLGYATPEGGIESFNAQLEMQLYHLCAGVNRLLEGLKIAQQVAVPANKREPLSDAEINAIWSEPLDRSKLSPFGMGRIRAILAAAQKLETDAQQVAEPTVKQPLSTERAALINTPEKVREFFGSNFDSLRYGRDDQAPDEDDKYTMSAHDIISAFAWSADMLEADAQWQSLYEQREAEAHKLSEKIIKLRAQQVAVPADYVLVPIEPTPEMLQAIWDGAKRSLHGAYKAMLAAAPQPPQGDKNDRS